MVKNRRDIQVINSYTVELWICFWQPKWNGDISSYIDIMFLKKKERRYFDMSDIHVWLYQKILVASHYVLDIFIIIILNKFSALIRVLFLALSLSICLILVIHLTFDFSFFICKGKELLRQGDIYQSLL